MIPQRYFYHFGNIKCLLFRNWCRILFVFLERSFESSQVAFHSVNNQSQIWLFTSRQSSNLNELRNGNMRKRIKTRGRSNADHRGTHWIRIGGGRNNNSIGVEQRDKILEESWSKVDTEPKVHNFNGTWIASSFQLK